MITKPGPMPGPMEGISIYDNPKNRFHVIRVYYAADPEKRKPSWKARNQPEYSEAAWDQEQEISFGSYAGRGIYRREFIDRLVEDGGHVLNSYELTVARPIYRVWDFGYHHPAVAFVQEDARGHHIVFDELMGEDIFLHNFIPLIMEKTDEYQGQYSGIIKEFCDRAGTQKKSTGKSDLEILHEFGIHPSYSQFDIISSIDYVRRALKIRRGDNQPVLQVVGPKCPIIKAALAGGYRYPPKHRTGVTIEKDTPLKDGYYEHLADCIRYYVSHKLRFLRANVEVVNGKVRSQESESAGGGDTGTSTIQQVLIGGSRIGGGPDQDGGFARFAPLGDRRNRKPEDDIAQGSEDDGDEARYSQNGDLLPSTFQSSQIRKTNGKVQIESAGGVQRRQIMVRYNPIGGPTYSKFGG